MLYEQKQIEKLIHKMRALEKPYLDLVFERIEDIECSRYDTEAHLRRMPNNIEWKPIDRGASWGGPFQTMWLRGQVKVPEKVNGKRLVLFSGIDAHECLVFVNGKPSGLFNKDGDIYGGNHSVVLLTKASEEGQVFDLALECYAGTPCVGWKLYENYGRETMPDEDYIRTYEGLWLCSVREDVLEFVMGLKVLNQLLDISEEGSLYRGQVLKILMKVFEVAVQYPIEVDEKTWRQSMQKASELMQPLLTEKNGPYAGEVGLIGHAHLDTAWLWTSEEAKRKCARTFSNALKLMEWYPDYIFLQSSVLHTHWIEEHYPDIFEEMKMRITQGRYEPNGGVWVECDCNMTGAESLVRQFLWGQRYTMKNFDYQSDCFWLPDTFGYSPAVPQIMKGFGISYFLTTKMAWNESNRFPYDTFIWQGMDGTEVLVHLNRMDVWPDVNAIHHHYKTLTDKHVSDCKLIAYGYGDGGGGPQYQMVEMANRVKNIHGCPESRHLTVSEFMKSVDRRSERLPLWVGELYLELHRGTLTSIHDMKRSNRQAEITLRDYEVINVMASVNGMTKSDKGQLTGWWYSLLKNQFHDILPGTCIPQVYDEVIAENDGVISEAKSESKKILKAMRIDDNGLTLVNTLSWRRDSYISLKGETYLEGLICQPLINLQGEQVNVYYIELPPMGTETYELSDVMTREPSSFTYDNGVLITPLAKIRFGVDGSIVSFVESEKNRQLCRDSETGLNTFYMAEDVPLCWDNWDIDPDVTLKLNKEMRLVSSKVVANGYHQFRIENEYHIGRCSTLRQQMIFFRDRLQIEFETEVVWHEKHSLLKVGFDVNILTDTICSEMQFGHVERSTHSNTSWDAAKTEFCNHKWSDLSEARYGVALLNDCKYGVSCERSNMMLTLIKSGTHPDPRGDQGTHCFRYALVPHEASMNAVNVIQPAYEFNTEVISVSGEISMPSLVTVSEDNIIIESIKPPEEGQGYVIRLYESEKGFSQGVVLTFGYRPHKVTETNMLEQAICDLKVQGCSVTLDFRPFEIKTILVTLEN